MEVVIKGYLQRADSSVEVRRIPLTREELESKGFFKVTSSKMASAFPDLASKRFTFRWQDSDGDMVLMSTDEELVEAISQAKGTALKVYISVDGEKETSPEEYVVIPPENEEEPNAGKATQGDHHKEDPFQRGFPFRGPGGMNFPPGPPPPPGFDGCPRPDFGFASHTFPPFGPNMAFMGGRGGMRKRGHPGHHFGHHMGMPGPFGHGPFGGHHSFFHGMGMHGGPHHPHGGPHHFHGGHHHFHGGPHHPHGGHHGWHHFHKEDKHGWKANLRDAVPVAHRRWAKTYIRDWRVQNLKNATTTSSDNDQDKMTMEEASVPESYLKWLNLILPKWHKKWGQQENGQTDGEGVNAAEKEKLKTSVPKEFRKWVKWYLMRRFGKREEPKFHGCGGLCQADKQDKKAEKCLRKDWKKAYKMHTIAASIPVKHRRWAKVFIRDWRLEKKITDAKGAQTSESEDSEKDGAPGDISIPEDYARWMQKFLTRWHLWRGQLQTQNANVDNSEMKEFKDTVPKVFRKWVKCYMCHRYQGVAGQAHENTATRYQRWLQAFQSKWLSDLSKGIHNDELVLTSSDDENNDTEQEMESSLKKLRLENNGNGGGTKVQPRNLRFDANDNSDIDDAFGPSHKKINPGFRQWAKVALFQWDGTTVNGEGQDKAVDEEQIPPHVYNWMSKLMYKMQMKRMKKVMKHEMKQAKGAMKAAKKAHKYGHF